MSANSGQNSPKITAIHNEHDGDGQSSTSSSTKLTRSQTVTKESAKKEMVFDDELESMLSLSQTFSFWDVNGGDKSVASYAETFASDEESTNSLLSASTFGEGRGDGYGDGQIAPLVACGEGIEDASNAFVESIVDTGRAISYVLKEGSKTKKKLVGKIFMTAQERKDAKKEKMKQLEEDMRLKREEQLREEMRNAREEVGLVANLWRER